MQKMNLSIYQRSVLEKYRSNSQRARVLTEDWFEKEMYCPACLNEELVKNPNNTQVTDFFCDICGNSFQLKSQTATFGSRVVDGAFDPMIESVAKRINPSFFFLHYSASDFEIRNLLLIPKFFFSESIIEKRKPLTKFARRFGWVGCNILLSKLPLSGRINIVVNSSIVPKLEVRRNWKRLYFLNNQKPEKRAWTSDVLACVEKIGKKQFELGDLYGYEQYFAKLHPDNQHIRAKIRQQLQILRDKCIIEFRKKGYYSLK